MSESLKNFKNPEGFWHHSGYYSIETNLDLTNRFFPSGVQKIANKIIVTSGSVYPNREGIQCVSSKGHTFHLPFNFVLVVRDKDCNPIWVNKNHHLK